MRGLVITELNATIFQFPQVQSISYSINGSTRAWCELYESVCVPITRASAGGQ